MKNLIKPLLVSMLLAFSIIAHAVTISVNGVVTSSNTGLPVANHMVFIMSDSSVPGYSYYNSVYTDMNGMYSDNITVPGNTVITFNLGTYDLCSGWVGGSFTHMGGPQGVYYVPLAICTGSSTQCQAGFYAIPDTTYNPNGPFGVYFVNTSQGSGVVTYQWSFGDGTTSASMNPSHSYTSAGSYMVCLTIATSNNCTSTFCDTITVGNINPPCSNSFISNVTPNGVAVFTVTPNPIVFYTSYFWTFGDGGTSTLASPTHTYAQSGFYTITLTTTDNTGCTAVSTQTLYVSIGSTGCQAMFSYIPDSSPSALVYNFIDLSVGNPVSWLWNFGDGGTSTSQYPIHTYLQSGYYYVCLTITGSNNCTSTECDTIYVGTTFPNCYNYFTSTSQNLYAAFSGYAYGGTAPYSYFWDFGDGSTGTSQYAYHTYAQAGNYVVTLTTSDITGCNSTSSQMIMISNGTGNCQAMFYSFPDSLNPNTIYFGNISTGSYTNVLWNFGDNTTSTQVNPSHIYASGGTYMVCLTIFNNGTTCQSTYCDTIYVGGGVPCANYFYYGSQLLYTSFYGYAYGGTPPYTFSWSFGDGTGSALQNPSHTYAAAGTYTVSLTTTDANGCTFTSTQAVTITNSNPMSLWGQVTANNLPVDYGTVYLFGIAPATNNWIVTDSASIDSAGYYWFNNVFPGMYSIVAGLNPNSSLFLSYVPTYYGNTIFWGSATIIQLGQPLNPYNIELQAAMPPFAGPGNINGIITTGNKFVASGLPVPNVEIMLLDMSNNPLKLDYSDANGMFSFSNLPYGTYKVYAEVGGLNTNPAIITLDNTVPSVNNLSLIMTLTGISTGINEKPELSVNNIYPNPASNNLTLELNTLKSGNISLIVSDVLGNMVLSNNMTLTSGNNRLNINTTDLTPGSYSLQCVLSDGTRITRKITIVR
jgi:PKD repeat protein